MAQILKFKQKTNKSEILDDVLKDLGHPVFIPTSGEDSHWAYPSDHPMVEFLDEFDAIDSKAIFAELNKALEQKLEDKMKSLKEKE